MPGTVCGESTIDPAHPFAWSGNIGWTNWRANTVDGARTGEYVLSGAIWLSNAGWVQLGDGTPANSVRYENNSATDFGVNLHEDFTLRGFAYGANIGWLQFESSGNPHIDPATGRLRGYAWSANLGWINLGNGSGQYVATMSIPMSPDLDTDGISDAWELEMAGELKTLSQTGDYDADGLLDLDEYAADSNPLDSSDGLRITQFTLGGGTTQVTLGWTSRVSRIYHIESCLALEPGNWTESPLGGITSPANGTISRAFTVPAASQRFYRIRAGRPLAR